MKKSELILKLNAKLLNFKTTDVEKIINIFFDKITKSLIENKRIEIRGFGSFRTKTNKGKIRGSWTDEEIKAELTRLGFYVDTTNSSYSFNEDIWLNCSFILK